MDPERLDPERRVLLAIFLAFIVLYAWQALFVKPAPKPPVTPVQTTVARPEVAPTAPPASAPAEKPEQPATPAAVSVAIVGETGERDIRVETADVIAVFTNRGARLKSWRLKHYRDPGGTPQELVAAVS